MTSPPWFGIVPSMKEKEEFFKNQSNNCPECESEYIFPESFHDSGLRGTRRVVCHDCWAEWNEDWKIVDFTIIKKGI